MDDILKAVESFAAGLHRPAQSYGRDREDMVERFETFGSDPKPRL